MAETQDVNLLKRRGRRRLVGAVALVLVAVIVLPMVFDPEPRQNAPAISVRIPGEDDARFAPKLAAQPPLEKATVAEPAPAAAPPAGETPKPAAAEPGKTAAPPAGEVAVAEQKVAPPSPPSAKPALAKPAPAPAAKVAPPPAKPVAPTARKGDFVVQVAALGEDDKVKALVERLGEAKLPHYTEPVAIAKGKVTRVRVGPFASREAAERAHKALTAMGLKPGGILERP